MLNPDLDRKALAEQWAVDGRVRIENVLDADVAERIQKALLEQLESSGLDVVLLNNLILGPILGISDPRTSKRLEYVPGTVPLEYMATEGAGGAFFLVHPTKMSQVAAVADRGLVMPPKSTWFLPKISSGLFVRLFD